MVADIRLTAIVVGLIFFFYDGHDVCGWWSLMMVTVVMLAKKIKIVVLEIMVMAVIEVGVIRDGNDDGISFGDNNIRWNNNNGTRDEMCAVCPDAG